MHVHSPRLKGEVYAVEEFPKYDKVRFEMQLNLQLRGMVSI